MILYIILLIVTFILLYNKINKLEGFEEDTKKEKSKKCLLVYYGGAFRDGIITRDSDYGYEAQERVSITHSKLKKVLNTKGFQTDILINTRSTKYSNKLEDWYSPLNIIMNNLSNKIHAREYMMQSTIKNINKLNKNDYDFILIIRIDIFLKPEFYNVLNTESEKINFLANNYNPRTCENIIDNELSVVDICLFIPKKYYYILDENFKLWHNSWYIFKNEYGLTDDDMTFMSNIKFDSDTLIDNNPYYTISGKKENTNLHNNNIKNNKCLGYNIKKQEYVLNPSEVYINKYNEFYK
jgi:hypothetical protein